MVARSRYYHCHWTVLWYFIIFVPILWSLGGKTRAGPRRRHGAFDWTYSSLNIFFSLLWRHNERDSVSNHQPHDCLLNRSFRCRSNETSKPCVTSLCAGISPVTGEFPPQKASNAENVPIWWRHHVIGIQRLYDTSLRRFKCKSGKVSLSFLW